MNRPTDTWLTAASLPPLTGSAGTAERLLLLLHYGIDWTNGWVAPRRRGYWEAILPDRVITSTYRAATLRGWWTDIATELRAAPRSRDERAELEHHLRAEPLPVLQVLRGETAALLLRTRIVSEAVRERRNVERQEPSA